MKIKIVLLLISNILFAQQRKEILNTIDSTKVKIWEEIKKINGNISYNSEGAFKNVRNRGYKIFKLNFSKKVISSKIFKKKLKIKKIILTIKK